MNLTPNDELKKNLIQECEFILNQIEMRYERAQEIAASVRTTPLEKMEAINFGEWVERKMSMIDDNLKDMKYKFRSIVALYSQYNLLTHELKFSSQATKDDLEQ